MQTLTATVSDLVTMTSGVIALYFFVSLVVNLAQAQVSSATGDALGHARALQQGIASVLLLALAFSANVLVPVLQGYLTPSEVPQSTAAAFSIWEGLARFVTVAVLAGTGLLTAVAVVFAELEAQASHALGTPRVLSRSMTRLAALIGGGILAMSSTLIANWLLSIFFQ